MKIHLCRTIDLACRAVNTENFTSNLRVLSIGLDFAAAALQLHRELPVKGCPDRCRGTRHQSQVGFSIETEPAAPGQAPDFRQVFIGQEMQNEITARPEQGSRVPATRPGSTNAGQVTTD